MSARPFKREPISDGQRYRILRRDGFRCVFCGASASEAQLQVDHLWPVSRGGGDDEWNLAAACKSCNSGKRAAAIDRFAARDTLFRDYYQALKNERDPEMRDACEKCLWKFFGPISYWLEPDLSTLRSIGPFLEAVKRGERFDQ